MPLSNKEIENLSYSLYETVKKILPRKSANLPLLHEDSKNQEDSYFEDIIRLNANVRFKKIYTRFHEQKII